MSTQIKRLIDQGKEFVPITLQEAVVVNTENLPGLSGLGLITTLDKVLLALLSISGTNTGNITNLQTLVNNINTELSNKQDKLTPGAGINISSTGVISVTNSIQLYKIVTSLPTPSSSCANNIYLVAQQDGISGNKFNEFICVSKDNVNWDWENIGTVSTDIDLSGYITTEQFNNQIQLINNQMITATNVIYSNGSNVQVDYEIPNDLYG